MKTSPATAFTAAIAACAILLTGCASERPQVLNGASLLTAPSATLLPGGDYHLITVRDRTQAPNGDGPVFCAEPSPDWAVAFGRTLAAAASGGQAGGPSASISGSSSSTQAISAMTGRTAGVVALRDGLYAACQAYANHIIGKDAYSLVLSQYGNLLVSLANGGSGSASAGAAAPAASAAPIAVAVTNGATAPAAPAKGTDSPAPAASAQVAIMQQEMLQAIFVACISANDPTARTPDSENSLLDRQVCTPFIRTVIAKAAELLTPQGTTPKPTPPPARRAPTPKPAAPGPTP